MLAKAISKINKIHVATNHSKAIFVLAGSLQSTYS